ncbi:MAG: ABC transporter substrate-binding protein [Clostridia bacterium]|jgi:peptide/nickel transport system substrate-binding protein
MKRYVIFALAFILLMSVTLSGCGSSPTSEPTQAPEESKAPAGEETKAPEETDESVQEVVYKESPFFEGKGLPPVAERLPKEPKLVNEYPAEHLKDGKLEIGKYGGMMRFVNPDPEWNPDIFLMLNEALMNTPGGMGAEVTANIVKNVEMSPDNKEFTFYLREGLKWSDGQPVTTEDVAFAFNDVIMNEQLTPVFPAWLRAGNSNDAEPGKLEIIDEYTFKISFTEAYGRFPIQLALTGWRGYTELMKPKHYLKDFHPNYVSEEELEKKIEEAGFEKGEWWNLFNDKDITNWELTNSKAIGFPMLYPWILVKSTETTKEYERNPYYHKVDAEGNQLPYIDTIRGELVQDVELATNKVIAGEVDFMREDAALNKMPLYKENEGTGGYKAVPLNMHVDPTCIWLNQTHPDPVWRQVVQDVRFRQALNMAIDREEIIDAIYYGFGELPKLVPSEYNPEQAQKLLDEMGLDKKDSQGFRLGPDGKVFEIPFEVAMHAPDIVPVTELVTEMWNDIGIKTTMKTIDTGLWGTRNAANELKASNLWNVQPMWRSGGWLDFMPTTAEGKLWQQWWNTGGKEGEEPPAPAKRLFELGVEIMKVYPNSPEDVKLYEEIYKIHYDNIFQMPIAEKVKQPLIVNGKMGNIPVDGTAVAVNLGGETLYYSE